MSESRFTLFYTLLIGLESPLYAVCLAFFFHPFTGRTAERNQRRSRELFVFVVYTALFPLFLLPFFNGWMHIAAVSVLLAAVSGFLGMERKFIVLLNVMFYCLRNLSMMILRSLDYFTSELFLRNADTPEKVFLDAAYNAVLVDALQFSLFFAMLYVVRRLLERREVTLHIRELCRLLLIPVTGILFVNIVLRLLVVSRENEIFRLYEEFPAFLAVVPVTAALFYIGILVTISSCQRLAGLQEERKKYFVGQQQIRAIEERLAETERLYDGIRQMKHDMKNHLTNIRGLAGSGQYGELEQYIAKMDESINALELTVRTGNAVTDIILNDKRNAAVRQGIRFTSEFTCPDSRSYSAYDIGIILSNLLENALEACVKEEPEKRFIFLLGRQKRRFFLIEVRNSFSGEIIRDTHTDLPLSTKEPSAGISASLHGIGLSNVKRTAEKYRGDLDIKIQKNEFCVTVLLQERR